MKKKYSVYWTISAEVFATVKVEDTGNEYLNEEKADDKARGKIEAAGICWHCAQHVSLGDIDGMEATRIEEEK